MYGVPVVGMLLRFAKSKLTRNCDSFLAKAAGVIHVGANSGQERTVYDKHKLNVLWIEPIPEVFEKLKANLETYPKQSALQCLVADQDDAESIFHVSNNSGESSSVLELSLHKDIWPEVYYERSITLRAITLASLVDKEYINTCYYDSLVIDTQGSELLVLKGALPILHWFRFIKAEVPDFEAYTGCSQMTDVRAFLGKAWVSRDFTP
jgi:FkbM family methyltransferase